LRKPLCLSRQEIETRLREKDLQPTLQRVGICQYVLCEGDHPTAEQVHRWAEENLGKISLATVYNTLNSLVKVGLLREFNFSHMEKAIYDNNLDRHHHFFDEVTGQIHDVPFEFVNLETDLGRQFQVKGYEILLKGVYKENRSHVKNKPTKE
jgi:Fur family iron response transcriptional regulator